MSDPTIEPLTDLLAILRAIKEDIAVIRGELADMRRRLIAIEARQDRAERRSRAGDDD
jgi:hypothetical protein